MVSLIFMLIGLASSVSAAFLHKVSNASWHRVLGPEDGIILVDFWQMRPCVSRSRAFDALVLKVDPFIRIARDRNATIFHALSESSLYMNLSDPQWNARFWPTTKANRNRRSIKEVARFLERRNRIVRSPLDILDGTSKPDSVYCNGTIDRRLRDPHLHHNISFDFSRDFMFDIGIFFDKIAQMGIKRVFYAGAALNQCVLRSRLFSALEAVWSRKFLEVGIILDLTVANLRQHPRQPECADVSDYECSKRFATWTDTILNLQSLSFWETE